MKIRVPVDFNSLDDNGNVIINAGIAELETIRPQLKEGLSAILFDESLEVEGRITWDDSFKMWVGVPDWQTIRHPV